MNRSILVRRGLIWTAGALGSLLVLAAGLAAAIEAGYFRGPLLRLIASQVGRAIEVDGALQLHVFALHPWATAERVTIGNPAWVPPGTTAVIRRAFSSRSCCTSCCGPLGAVSARRSTGPSA